MNDIKFPVSECLNNITIRVRVTGTNVLKIKLKLGVFFIKFGCFILGSKTDIKVIYDEKEDFMRKAWRTTPIPKVKPPKKINCEYQKRRDEIYNLIPNSRFLTDYEIEHFVKKMMAIQKDEIKNDKKNQKGSTKKSTKEEADKGTTETRQKTCKKAQEKTAARIDPK